jgi:hypothetical protein
MLFRLVTKTIIGYGFILNQLTVQYLEYTFHFRG